MALSSLSISRPITTLMFYVAVVMLGVIAFQNLAVDFLPPMKIPRLTIQTSFPNTSPEEIENAITKPIEAALSTIAGVKKVSSVSREGVSIVTTEFYWGTDMDFAMLDVREKLDQLRAMLPREVNRPTILRFDPSSEPIMTVALSSKDESGLSKIVVAKFPNTSSMNDQANLKLLVDLKETAEALIKRRIEQIAGVAQVTVLGGVDREIQVDIDIRNLQILGISIDQISQTLENANLDLPGGTVKRGLLRYSLRTAGEFTRIEEIQDVIVAQSESGRFIRIGDIGKVVDGFKERMGLTRYNGQEIISLEIRKEAGANTIVASKKIHQVLRQMEDEYPKLKLTVLSDQTDFISKSVNDLQQAIIVGAILAFVVLFFFLRSSRIPLIIGLTTLISIIATFVLMYCFHVTLNIISLTGLALGVGMLGDNAIIVVENVTRLREKGMGIVEAAITGAKEINVAVTASTLTNVAIFLPIVSVNGVAQQIFVDMGITMTVSLLVSLLVAVTLVPMLVSRKTSFSISDIFLRRIVIKGLGRESGFVKKALFGMALPFQLTIVLVMQLLLDAFSTLKIIIHRIVLGFYKLVEQVNIRSNKWLVEYLNWGLNKRTYIIWMIVLLLLVSIGVSRFIPSENAPDIDNSRFSVEVEMAKGTSLEAVSAFISTLENELLRTPEIEGVYSSIGNTEGNNLWTASNVALEKAQLEIKVRDEDQTNEVIGKVREELRRFQENLVGVSFSVKKRGTTLDQLLRPEQNDIKVRVTGREPTVALTLANRFVTRLKHVAGLVDLRTNLQNGNPEYKIVINQEQAGKYGLTVHTVAQYITDFMKGKEATYLSDFDRKITILVRPRLEQRRSMNDLLSSCVSAAGTMVPIRELVQWEETEGYEEIWRENQQRSVVMVANVNGRSNGDVVNDIRHEITNFSLPAGYAISIGGENEEIQESFQTLLLIIFLSIILVYMILAAQYESLLYPFVILLSSPLAFIGSVFAMAIARQHYNLMSLIGIVIMIGAVDNDAVIAVDIITTLRREGKSLRDSVIEGMKLRLRPILMTTATTLLGVVPLIFEFGNGSELVRALTIPLFGGLIASTFFTIIAIPIFYTYIDRWAMGREAKGNI